MNTASRMESTSHPGLIQVSEATWELLKDTESFRPTGGVEVKGKGVMSTFIWVGDRVGSRRISATRTNHAAPARNAAASQGQSSKIISKAMAAADDDLVVNKRLRLRHKRSTTCANLKICVKSQRRKSFVEHFPEYL